MMPSRRQFIRTGLAGSVLLTFAGWLNAAGVRALTAAERDMLGAVANAMLDGALPTDGEPRRRLVALTVDGIANEVASLAPATQLEVGELFGLLVVAPARMLVAGVRKPWREASIGDVGEFLESWRMSRVGVLQGAYAALHDLTFGAWYARPDTWDAIGYPGPPKGYF